LALILAIETATISGSVALVRDAQMIGLHHYHIDKSHSALLHEMIRQLMDNTGIEMDELDAIAVSEGPGSYTGLRIGVAAAKGICYSLDLPLIAINTLEAMACDVRHVQGSEMYYCPMIDARRMEVYTAVFDHNMQVVRPIVPVVIDENSFGDLLKENKVLFFGDGAAKCKTVIAHEHAIFIDDVEPSARYVGILADKKFAHSQIENLVSFEPFYLKEFRTVAPKNH